MSETIRASLPQPGATSASSDHSAPSSNRPAQVGAASAFEGESSKDESFEGEPTEGEASNVPVAHREVVQRLRAQVEQAVATIERLRATKERLEQRVRELEKRPAVPEGETLLALEQNPDALRAQVEGFIAAIDRYLEDDVDVPGADPTAGSTTAGDTAALE